MKKLLPLLLLLCGCEGRDQHEFSVTISQANNKTVVTVDCNVHNREVKLKTKQDVENYKKKLSVVMDALENAEKMMVKNEQE